MCVDMKCPPLSIAENCCADFVQNPTLALSQQVQQNLFKKHKSCWEKDIKGNEETEEEGFEPPVGCPTSVFKTDAFGHSATLPQIVWSHSLH